MIFLQVIQALFALAVSLGLFGLGVYAFRRWGPMGLVRLNPRADRRLQVVESLSLDPTRKLVLVRLDQREHLILLGEGRRIESREEVSRG